MFSGKTYNLNIHESGTLYSFDLKDVKIDKIVGPNVRKLEQIDEKQMKVTMADLNLNLTVDAELEALKFIPFVASGVNLKNISIEFTVESVSDDQVHWALKDASVVTLGDYDIQMSNSFLTKLVQLCKPIITKVINDQLPMIGQAIDKEIQILNQKVANETAYTFDLDVLGKNYPLNMTMTKAPEVDGEIIRLNFDGLFNQPENYAGYKMDSHGYFPQIEAQKEQFWIHENTINTLLMDAVNAGYSIDRDASELMPAFPEVTSKYPNATNFTTKTSISVDNQGTPIRFLKDQGVMMGADKDLKFTMDLYADDKKVITFGLESMFNMEFIMDNKITFFPKFKNAEVFTASVKHSEVPLKPGKGYTQIMEVYITSLIKAFNTKYEKGVPVASLMPELAMISGVLRNATMTPHIADGWMYAGFSMQEDLNKFDESYELKFLTN